MTSAALIVALNALNLPLHPRTPKSNHYSPLMVQPYVDPVIALIQPNFNPADSLGVMGGMGGGGIVL